MTSYATEILARDEINQLYREAEAWRLTRKAMEHEKDSRPRLFRLRRRLSRPIFRRLTPLFLGQGLPGIPRHGGRRRMRIGHGRRGRLGAAAVAGIGLLTLAAPSIAGSHAASRAWTDPAVTNHEGDDRHRNECVGAVEAGAVGKCTVDLQAARDATARYRDYEVALQEGFFPVSHCVTSVEEHGSQEGTMGIHHFNPGRNDQRVDVREPEILLYVPDRTSGMRLVAIEYSRDALVDGKKHYGPVPPQSGAFDPPPELFGRAFDGPMAGHNPLQPWHYDLHVWAWSRNPSGLFAQFNPEEDCVP